MAISGDLRVSAALGSYPGNSIRSSLLPSKVDFSVFLEGGSSAPEVTAKSYRFAVNGHSISCHAKRPLRSAGDRPQVPLAKKLRASSIKP